MINRIKMIVSIYTVIRNARHEVKFSGGVTGSQWAAASMAAYLLSQGCSESKAVDVSVSLIMDKIDPILSSFQMQFNHAPDQYDWSGIVLKKISD